MKASNRNPLTDKTATSDLATFLDQVKTVD
jgi:hypothetical protein